MTPNFRIFCFAAFVLACIAALTVSTLAQADDEETRSSFQFAARWRAVALFSRVRSSWRTSGQPSSMAANSAARRGTRHV